MSASNTARPQPKSSKYSSRLRFAELHVHASQGRRTTDDTRPQPGREIDGLVADQPLPARGNRSLRPDRARVAGFIIHLGVGQGFALGYAGSFSLLGRATWWLGGAFGLLHAAIALGVIVPLLAGVHPRMASARAGPACTATLEPPGLLGLNYGTRTPVVAVVAHLVYGVALGILLEAH